MALTTPVATTGLSSPLLSEALLCLLAARVVNYQPGDPWPNVGTARHALDAHAVIDLGATPPSVAPTYLSASDPGGPGFVKAIPVPIPPERPRIGTATNRMFDIAGTLLAPADDEPWTCTICTTPLYSHPASVRYLWKYSNSSLPISPAGLVIENVNNFPAPGPTVGHGLIAAIYNGPGAAPPTFVGGSDPGVDIQGTRQVVALRYNPEPVPPATDGAVTVWRNGTTFAAPAPITQPGPWIDATHIRIGSGQICHAVLWHDRALTDAEMTQLSQILLG